MKIDTKTIERLRDQLMERGQRPTNVLSTAYEALTKEGLLTAEETEIVGEIDPIAEAMFLMMAADGTIAEEEVDVVRGAVRDMSGSKLRSGTIKVMLDSYNERMSAEGWEYRLVKVSDRLSHTTSAAEMAYTLVAAVALADKEVTMEENEVIDRFAELLGLTDQRCCDLLAMVKQEQKPPWAE